MKKSIVLMFFLTLMMGSFASAGLFSWLFGADTGAVVTGGTIDSPVCCYGLAEQEYGSGYKTNSEEKCLSMGYTVVDMSLCNNLICCQASPEYGSTYQINPESKCLELGYTIENFE